jgi:transposase
MIQRQLKLRLNTSQESQLNTWLFQLTGVWNWAIRKIEQDTKDGIYYTRTAFYNLLADHGKKRGGRQRLAARLQERLANQRKDRNHKLSRRLVADNHTIVWSKDHHAGIAKAFGKSVASAGHAQLRGMLAYKCTASGRQFLEVPSQYSTKTCSACGSLSGPTGHAGLQVRQWTCACGATHNRDVNAAVNTLLAGVGTTHERHRKVASGIPRL